MNTVDAEEEPFEPLSSKSTNDADALAVSNGNSKVAILAEAGKLIEEEAVAEGQVSLNTYLTYLKAGGFSLWTLILAMQVATQLISVVKQVRDLH